MSFINICQSEIHKVTKYITRTKWMALVFAVFTMVVFMLSFALI